MKILDFKTNLGTIYNIFNSLFTKKVMKVIQITIEIYNFGYSQLVFILVIEFLVEVIQ